MQNETALQPVVTAAPSVLARNISTGALLTAMLLAPFAGAEGIETLAATAGSGTAAVQGVVMTIAGVALTIGMVIWGVRHMKPKN